VADEAISYDKADLRRIIGAFKAMDEEATDAAKRESSALAEFAQGKIQSKAESLSSRKVASRIAQGSKVSKSSKIGELSIGFASQKFSGGGTTKELWGGAELALISLNNSRSGLVEKDADLKAGSFIRPCEPFSRRSWLSGKMLSTES
jgi:hypothetical protein